MAASNTGSKRLDRMNDAETARRRVVTRNGGSPAPRRPARPARTTPAVVLNFPGGGRSKRKPSRRRKTAMRPAAIGWSVVTSLLFLAAYIVQSFVVLTVALVSLGVTVAVVKIEAKRDRAAPPPPPRKRAVSRGSTRAARGGTGGGTPRSAGGTKAPAKGSGSGTREAVCSEACQVSPRPKSTCRCRAVECKHGGKAGLAT